MMKFSLFLWIGKHAPPPSPGSKTAPVLSSIPKLQSVENFAPISNSNQTLDRVPTDDFSDVGNQQESLFEFCWLPMTVCSQTFVTDFPQMEAIQSIL